MFCTRHVIPTQKHNVPLAWALEKRVRWHRHFGVPGEDMPELELEDEKLKNSGQRGECEDQRWCKTRV